MRRLISPRLQGLPRTVWVLVVGILITRAGAFLLPFLTIYLHTDRGLSTAFAGATLGAFGVGGIIGSGAGGAVADRLGRQPVVAGAPIFQGVGVLLILLTDAPAALLGVSFLAGALGECGRPAISAMLTDLTPPDRRLDAFALFRLSINLGFAVGTGLGGLLITRYGFTNLFIVDAATSFVYAGIAILLIPETRHLAVAESTHAERGFAAVVADRVFRRFWLAKLTEALVFAQPMAVLALVLTDRGLSTSVYGGLISFNGLLIIATEFWISGRVKNRNIPRVMAVGSLLIGAGFALTGLAGASLPLLVLTVGIWTLGEMLTSPTGQAYASALAPPDLRGRYSGAVGIAYGLAFSIGPVLGGLALLAGPTPLWIGSLVLACVSAWLYLTLPDLGRPVAVEQPVEGGTDLVGELAFAGGVPLAD